MNDKAPKSQRHLLSRRRVADAGKAETGLPMSAAPGLSLPPSSADIGFALARSLAAGGGPQPSAPSGVRVVGFAGLNLLLLFHRLLAGRRRRRFIDEIELAVPLGVVGKSLP